MLVFYSGVLACFKGVRFFEFFGDFKTDGYSLVSKTSDLLYL